MHCIENYIRTKSPADLVAPFDVTLNEKDSYRVDVYLASTQPRKSSQITEDTKSIMDGKGIKAIGSIRR